MDVLSVTWKYEVGGSAVVETEHMFGYDVILCQEHEGRFFPRAIIARKVPMNGLEQRWARDWLEATLVGDWGTSANRMQSLQEGCAL